MFSKIKKKGKGNFDPNRNFFLGVKEGEYFKEWREIIERSILSEKGDTETSRKILKKYEKYFDNEEGNITLHDLSVYKKAILAEIEKKEKKNDVFLPV